MQPSITKISMTLAVIKSTLKQISSKFRTLIFGIALGLLVFSAPSWVSAQIVEPGFESAVVVDGLNLATAVAFTPDNRIFIAEKSGVIKVVKDGVLLPQPLVTLTDINSFGDRGLIGLAIDPNFTTNGYIYVSYTYENTPGFNIAGPKTGRIVRLTVSGDVASESSKFVLVGSVGGTLDTPSCEDFAVTADCIASDSNSHSVGGLRFGSDGKLYASLGDGADFSDVDPRALRAQNVNALAGKILRINTDGTAPTDNPFYDGNVNSNKSKVYALGLRNAFRFNFNPTTNLLYAGDVGWSSWEEINLIKAGGNYGWPCREGNVATSYGCVPSSVATDPLYTYAHNSAGAGSITGGAFPDNSAYPAQYSNSLFIGDYAQMWMKRLVLNASGTAVVSVENFIPETVWPVEIITGADGNVYYLDIVFGSLNRLTHTSGNRHPVVSVSSNKNSGTTPLAVNFSSIGTSDPDGDLITYLWKFGDGATSTAANPSHTYTVNGVYNAILTAADAYGAEASKSIKIYAGNQAPVANIISPVSGSLYTALQEITVTGEGTDPEAGVLPPSAMSWSVLLHHNTHVHPILNVVGTSTISFTADNHNASDVYMEVILTVTDSAGLANSQSINMYLNNGAGSGNLVSNPSMEIEGAVPSSPLDWYQGWYGVMNPVFTYPEAGLSGAKASKIEVTSYTSGSAKWYFSPAFVTVGEKYNFSNLYTATVPTNLFAQYGKDDGSFQYVYIATVPATSTPSRNSYEITIPADVKTVSIFHEIDSIGQLVVDDYSLSLVTATDTVLPTGTIANINEGETLSGVKIVEVTANDNIGVATVHLEVDGVEVGVGDSEAPFSVILDTNSLTDGAHTISAHIHDLSGNAGESAAVSVNIANSATTTPVNLIQNGNFEIVNGLNPLGWNPSGWGTHASVFTYPVSGSDGGVGAEVKITKYNFGDTGDAKWAHEPVSVVAGTEYTYKTKYKGTSISDLIGMYTFADGSTHYFGLIKEIQATSTWTQLSKSFVPPADAVTVTLYHLISSESTLNIDEVELFVTGTGTPSEIVPPVVEFTNPLDGQTVSGNVTFTASSSDNVAVTYIFYSINGTPVTGQLTTSPYNYVWDTTKVANGDYVLKATTHDPSGNNSTNIITVTVNNSSTSTSTNLVLNGNFETAGLPNNPANWNQGGWGTNTRTFTYPATGVTGNGAKLDVSGYTNGDAKWYFDPVAVTPGTQYTVSDQYNSTVGSEILARYTLGGGAFQYQFLSTLPSTAGAWQTFSQAITAPANSINLTLFHLIAGNGSLTLDNMSVTGPASTSTDTTAPAVNITAPTNNSTISDTINVTANATDNVAVAGVKLMINGAQVGLEDTMAPYSFAWDTKTVTNGTNTIAVIARDAANNTTTSAVFNVIVNNIAGTTSTSTINLIANGDLEIVGTAGNPTGWNQGGWGTNNRVLTHPVAGEIGNGASIAITSYTDGDAKWYFDELPVTAGQQFTFTHSYKSNVATNLTIRYKMADGSYTYAWAGDLPVSNVWKKNTITFIVPANAQFVTVMHILNKVGELSIDEYGLYSGNNNTFNRGKVSFSFDDGWLEHYQLAKPILDAANIDGTFYIITDEMLRAQNDQELVQNFDLETAGLPNNPANWNQGGWGTNTRTFTYPATGVTGNGAEVVVSGYVDGDAKWYFDPITITSGMDYIIKDQYKSTVPSEILVRYTLNDSTFQYQFLSTLPSTGGVWQNFTQTVTAPTNATNLTVFHTIAGNGSLVIDDMSVRNKRFYANTSQLLSLQASGHDIGVHTRNHPMLTTLDLAGKTDEIAGSRQALIDAGFLPVSSIAYPYGDFDNEVKQVTKDAGLTLGRSVLRGYNDKITDPYALMIQQVHRTRTLAEMKSWIDHAAETNTWLIFMFHQINNNMADEYGITESDFTELVNYSANANVDNITVAEGAPPLGL